MKAAEEAEVLHLFLCCLSLSLVRLSMSGWFSKSLQKDRCMNARQPLKVSFVVCFFSISLGQVVNALESNPTARRTQLHHKFEQVIALVEDNIYECCSEAWTCQYLLLTISSSCCQLPFSHLRGYLGMSVTGVIRLKCYYSSSKLLPGWKAAEQRIQTCLLSIIHLQSIPPFLWGCQEIFPNINPWNRHSSDWTLLSFRGNVWELRDGGFGMSLQLLGPTVRPGGNLNALNPFLKGTSQWCTVL